MATIVIGILGGLFLWVFYRSVRHQWPESYVSLSDAIDNNISSGLLPYAAFRLIPVYLAAVFVSVTADKTDGSVWLAVGITITIHLILTHIRALWGLFARRRNSSSWVNLVAFNILLSVLIVGAGSAAILTHRSWTDLVPDPEGSVTAMWTAALAAVLAIAFRNLTTSSPSRQELFQRARKDLGQELWDYIGRTAVNNSCDADVIRAIVLAEVLQRPKWTRKLETVKGKIIKSGTYGVAQISSQSPITDEQSIDRLCAEFANYFPPVDPKYGSLLHERFAARIEGHNADRDFVDSVIDNYRMIRNSAIIGTKRKGPDRRPSIEVSSVERRGSRWRISGTACVFEGSFRYVTTGEDGGISTEGAQANVGAPWRGEWEIDLPLEVYSITIGEPAISDEAIYEERSRTIEFKLDDYAGVNHLM